VINLTKKRGIVYVRVSDFTKQVIEREGQSLDHQEYQCIKKLEEKGYEVATVFREEGVSGKHQFRRAFQDMLKYIKDSQKNPNTRINCICIYSISRLGRNTRMILSTVESLMEKFGVDLISVSEPFFDTTANGRLMLELFASLSSFEISQLKSRTFPSMVHNVQTKGRYQGSRYTSYGYQYDKSKKKLEIVPEEAEQVKTIFQFYTQGIESDTNVGQFKIAKYLNENGFRYRDGTEWTSKRVSDVLKNETHTGTYVWNKKGTKFKQIDTNDLTEIKYEMSTRAKDPRPVLISYEKDKSEVVRFKNAHEAIIDEVLFGLAQIKLQRNKRSYNLNLTRQTTHLLSDILVCPSCGGRMTASKMSNGVYYKCQKANHSGMCDFNLVKEDYLLPTIKQVFLGFYQYHIHIIFPLLLMEHFMLNEELKDMETNEIVVLQNEKESLTALISEAYTDWKYNKRINEDTFNRVNDDATKKLNEINARIESISRQERSIKLNEQEFQALSLNFDKYGDVEKYFVSLDTLGQIELLKKYIIRIEYEKEKGKRGKNSIRIKSFIFDKVLIDMEVKKKLEKLEKTNSPLYERIQANIADIQLRIGVSPARTQDYVWKLKEIHNIRFIDRETGELSDSIFNITNEDYERRKEYLMNMTKEEMQEYFEKLSKAYDAYTGMPKKVDLGIEIDREYAYYQREKQKLNARQNRN
jgi:site-specific DNA recombinase